MSYVQTYTVVNVDGDSFPFAMLHYEGCFPATEEDSYDLLMEDIGQKVMLQRSLTTPNKLPDFNKWKKFGWEVLPETVSTIKL